MTQKSVAIDPSNMALNESQGNLRAFATTTNNSVIPFSPVPRLHLPPSNAPIGPRQYRQNLTRPNFGGCKNQSRFQHRFQDPPQRYQGPPQRFQGSLDI